MTGRARLGILLAALAGAGALASRPVAPADRAAALVESASAARGAVSAAGSTATSSTAATSSTSSTSTTSSTVATTSSTSSTTTVPPNTPVVLASGGVITVAVSALPTNLNPWTPPGSNQVSAEVAAQLWPSVFVTGPGGSEQPESSFVTSAEVVGVPPSSSFTVQYQINPKAVWSDGVPITAADFVYLWQQLRVAADLPATVPLAGYDDIASVVGSNDGRTVTVTFTAPDANWEGLFSDLLPAHVGEAGGFAGAFHAGSGGAVSGGPFVVSKVVPGSSLTLVRNARWWGAPANLDEIVLEVVRGSSAVIHGLQDGSIDLAELGPSAALNDDIAASSDLVARPELSPLLWQLVYNEADPLLAHLSVREALSDAVDRRELEWDTVGLDDPAVALARNHLYAAGAAVAATDGGAYQVSNDAAADDLLLADGYARNGAGLLTTETGTPITVRLVGPSGDGAARQIEALLRAELLDAGITLQVSNLPLRRLLAGVLPAGDFQIALVPYLLAAWPQQNATLYTDPVGPIAPATVASPGGAVAAPGALLAPEVADSEPGAAVAGAVTRDVGGSEDAGLAAIAAEAFGELNPAKLSRLYNRMDARIWDDLPDLPLFQAPVELVTRDDLANVTWTTTWAGPFWDADQWGIQVSPPPATTTSLP